MSKKRKILISISYLPFPVRMNGVSIRYFPITQYLSRFYDIHLLVVSGFDTSQEAMDEAKRYASKVSFYKREIKKVPLWKKILTRCVSFFPWHVPFPLYCYDNKEIERFIKLSVEGEAYDTALIVSLWNLEYIKKYAQASRYVMDIIDSPYLHHLRSSKPSLLNRVDSIRIKHYENKSISKVDYASYISPLDLRLATDGRYSAEQVGIIPNGIFLDDQNDQKLDFKGFVIGYLGNMGYGPNIQAALRLNKIFQRIKLNFPKTKLLIIGKYPVEAILALHNNSDVIVTGEVENIWPYVNAVNVFAFPMEVGSGQQNKLLEAMYAGIPVISTPLGNSGIGAPHGEAIIEAGNDEQFYNAISSMIEDENMRKKIGKNGKAYVMQTFDWNSIFRRIDKYYFGDE